MFNLELELFKYILDNIDTYLRKAVHNSYFSRNEIKTYFILPMYICLLRVKPIIYRNR